MPRVMDMCCVIVTAVVNIVNSYGGEGDDVNIGEVRLMSI